MMNASTLNVKKTCMRPQVTQVKGIKAALWFKPLFAFDLRAEPQSSLQMVCVRLTAHCSAMYQCCHLVTSCLHTPVTQQSHKSKSSGNITLLPKWR